MTKRTGRRRHVGHLSTLSQRSSLWWVHPWPCRRAPPITPTAAHLSSTSLFPSPSPPSTRRMTCSVACATPCSTRLRSSRPSRIRSHVRAARRSQRPRLRPRGWGRRCSAPSPHEPSPRAPGRFGRATRRFASRSVASLDTRQHVSRGHRQSALHPRRERERRPRDPPQRTRRMTCSVACATPCSTRLRSGSTRRCRR